MWQTLLSFSVLQGLFLGITLSLRRIGNRQSDLILASLLLFLSLHIAIYLAEGVLPDSLNIMAITIVQTLPFLYGPLILGFVKSTASVPLPRRQFAQHFIAAAIAAVIAASLGWHLQNIPADSASPSVMAILYLFLSCQFLHMFIYALYLRRWLQRFEHEADQASAAYRNSLQWIRLFVKASPIGGIRHGLVMLSAWSRWQAPPVCSSKKRGAMLSSYWAL